MLNSKCVTECIQGTFLNPLDPLNKTCDACHYTCKTCSNSLINNCITCGNSKYLTSLNTCESCDYLCYNCTGPTIENCTSCRYYELLNSTCVYSCIVGTYSSYNNTL